MLWNLDTGWLLMAVVLVSMISFLFGMVLDSVMGGDGFGPTGNMVVITGGFFLGVFLVNLYGISLRDMTFAVGAGLAGAFMTLGVLSFGKAALNRM